MNRRTFLSSSSLLLSSAIFAKDNKPLSDKSVVLIWLGGGPPTIDMWDLKPNTKYGGPFKPISTKSDFQICEHFPKLAMLSEDFSLVRNMNTREADHERGSYYMHTGFKPTPNIEHPCIGSIVGYEVGSKRKDLEIPTFFSIGTSSFNSGYLDSTYSPLVVDSKGKVSNLGKSVDKNKVNFLSLVEESFIKSNRGSLPLDHKRLYDKTIRLNTSPQMQALNISSEPQVVTSQYGQTPFGNSMLIARRLMQVGVPFVEVGFGGWDLHQNTHETLSNKLPELDSVVSAFILDLKRLDMWDNVAIIMMGEFGRTPIINRDAGRDHWASSWTCFLSGGLFNTGKVFGETSNDGIINGHSHSAEDIVATTCLALGIDTKKNYTSKRGRPMNIVNGGKIIYRET